MKSDSLKLLIEAGNPIISLETPDEPRAVQLVRAVAAQMALPVVTWSVTEGLVQTPPAAAKTLVEPGKVTAALRFVHDAGYPTLYLFKDLGAHCKDPQVVRHLRDLYFSPGSRLWTLLLIDAIGLPPEIRRLAIPFDIGWPDEKELEKVVRETFHEAQRRSIREVAARLTTREMEQLVQMLRGLTSEEAARVVMGAIYGDNVLDGSDLPRIMDAKRNLLGATGCLESIVADVAPEDIGGLHNLKRWLLDVTGPGGRNGLGCLGLNGPCCTAWLAKRGYGQTNCDP